MIPCKARAHSCSHVVATGLIQSLVPYGDAFFLLASVSPLLLPYLLSFLSAFSGVGAAAAVVVFVVALLFLLHLLLIIIVARSLVLLLLCLGGSAQGVVVVGFRESIISATLETQAAIMSPSCYCVASWALLL